MVTGPPGSGKTTLVDHLVTHGCIGVPEPAREVIAEQRAIDGARVYDKDPALFIELMLARAISDFQRMSSARALVFFDRGIPDLIAYAELFGLESSSAEQAAIECRYNAVVFALPGWPEIYETDEDRRMSLVDAEAFGAQVARVYEALGYTLIDVPLDSASVRASFVMDVVSQLGGRGASGTTRR